MMQWIHYIREVIALAEVVMVNRVRFTSSIEKELMPQWDKLSEETRIPKSRLLDEAIEDLLQKYEKKRALYL